MHHLEGDGLLLASSEESSPVSLAAWEDAADWALSLWELSPAESWEEPLSPPQAASVRVRARANSRARPRFQLFCTVFMSVTSLQKSFEWRDSAPKEKSRGTPAFRSRNRDCRMPRPGLFARLPCSQRRPKPGPVPARGAKHPWFSRSRSGQVFRLRRQASSPPSQALAQWQWAGAPALGGALRHHGGGSAGEFHPCSCVRPRLSSASPRVPSPYDTAPAPRCQDRKGAPPQAAPLPLLFLSQALEERLEQPPALLLEKAPVHLGPVAVRQGEQVRRRAAGHSSLPASQKEGRRPRQHPSFFYSFRKPWKNDRSSSRHSSSKKPRYTSGRWL